MRNEKGQSLVEVIIALAVAVVIIIALVRVVVTSIHNAGFARNRVLATRYAQEAIEEVRAFRDQTDWSTFTGACHSPPDLDPLPSPSPFTRTIECTGSGDKRTVTVTVTWTDAAGPHESKLTTYLTKWK